ncbi:asparagine synthase (glutamine-hydrolyzing) [Litoribacter ruber]|uniref:asparagine synthase (glutamine-hydrolyzing) n=1 Tax=Litoribacter ruber TaxID=702568 RepID=UPI001BDABFBE|nr:asparagine synthase (glutamine-hydrolyzing) [Litoribacter ruber]MBT0812435.1 asparagine synthase (glutamine-hydrolyzing) [Litoribacter ruber]
MCGINFLVNPGNDGQQKIRAMMEATQHRGPDHSDWVGVDIHLFVAGNRLKILDLGDLANQPIITSDGNGILVWNGALYNYQDLRNELLDHGVSFSTQSDSEVLIQWLKLFGAEGALKLEGMFSFVFVDKSKKSILVARDVTGKKPLYYFHKQNQWAFSSETVGIMASELINAQLDTEQLLPYFYSRHPFPENSLYKDVKQLRPGKLLELNFEGEIVSDISLEQGLVQTEKLPNLEEFENLLLDAVLKHFHAEVPVGVILSGGADSSLLLKTWHRETGTPLHTYTAVFEKKYQNLYPDAQFAREVATAMHCGHHEVLITQQSLLDNWPAYIASLDQPIGDSAGFLTWMIGKEAQNQVKVLISGAGADELFSGYNRHKAFRKYIKQPGFYHNLASFVNKLGLGSRYMKKFAASIDSDPMATYMNFSSLQNIPPEHQNQFRKYYPNDYKEPYKNALEWDRGYYLVNDILKVHDNATMAHGIEGRAPYLDKGILNLSRSLSGELHLGLEPKLWIKQLLIKYGLQRVAGRKKHGFGLPLKEWLSEEGVFRATVFQEIEDFHRTHGSLMPTEMRKIAENPALFVKSGFLQLFNLYILASWVKHRGL